MMVSRTEDCCMIERPRRCLAIPGPSLLQVAGPVGTCVSSLPALYGGSGQGWGLMDDGFAAKNISLSAKQRGAHPSLSQHFRTSLNITLKNGYLHFPSPSLVAENT